ncbi:putative F-box domain, galactose oxidase, beta-propeller [Medicago truncatula]|uniref:F-box/kelch-repeat plant-like protein n=1 Tax=Medicago truncatula TaxID=3880 RepID=G7LHZ0_MEDTR|nr:F-box/kelch-repeat protein At2g44130 [Medicago truncatula]AET04184.1 F-box/kelch-repeat plant-like protein [Medicago truncatula]RHN42594.1 putative F-box domain, galactose oxidase, beta-propeller [Medicago truncatula]
MDEFIELIPGLPSELGLECLTRLSNSSHRVALRVCNQWRRLFLSDEFYSHRKNTGHTRKVACLVQAHEQQPHSEFDKQTGSTPPSYDITVFDPESMSWDRVDPVPEYPSGLPLFCQLTSCEGKLVVMGGWDPASYEPLTAVFVYDFRMNIWWRGKDMPEKRSFFATGSGYDRVFVAGGHDENKNALKTAWAYDPKIDEWTMLAPMSQDRDECEGTVVGGEFWVVSGYATESQGMFDDSAEVLDIGSGQWRRVEGVWEAGRCPRSCVDIRENGKVVDPGLRIGVCSVRVGSRKWVTGSEYEGAPYGFYLVENDEGQNRKLNKISSVPDGFAGFVQSGCCVEI